MTLLGPTGQAINGERECRGCGCTDSHACPGGCSWACLDVDELSGICTTCAARLRWHIGLMTTIGRDPEAFEQILAMLEQEARAA